MILSLLVTAVRSQNHAPTQYSYTYVDLVPLKKDFYFEAPAVRDMTFEEAEIFR